MLSKLELRRQRQMDLCEFVVYMVSSRTVKAMQRDCVSRRKEKRKRRKEEKRRKKMNTKKGEQRLPGFGLVTFYGNDLPSLTTVSVWCRNYCSPSHGLQAAVRPSLP